MTEAQIYEMPTLPPVESTSEVYSFAANENDVNEERYVDVKFSQPNQTTMQQANSVETTPPSSPTRTKRSQNDFFNLKWILIAAAIALLVNLVVAIIGIWLAVQGNDRNTQAQIEANERLNSVEDALKNNTETQAKELNTRVDNLQDVFVNGQNSLNKSMDTSFSNVQKQVDTILKTFGFLIYHQTNLTEVLQHLLTTNSLSDIIDFLIQHQGDFINDTTSIDSAFQIKINSFTNIFRYLVYHKLNVTEGLEVLQTEDSMFSIFRIRLVGGNSKSGRVEIYHDGRWGTICDDILDSNAGNLMCRMLGFTRATQVLGGAHYGQGSGTIWLDDLECSGNETKLEDCTHRGWGVENCGHGEDLSIICA